MNEPKDPLEFSDLSDTPSNTGFSDDERRLVNPRNWGRDGEGEESEDDFDDIENDVNEY